MHLLIIPTHPVIIPMKNPSPLPTAAVAIIRTSFPRDSVLILRRSSRPEDPWSGHFSFPGGRTDPEDADLFATCLRETTEETGIRLKKDHLIATLAPQPAGRNFSSPLWVTPFLFQLQEQPTLKLEFNEVVSGFWLAAEAFQDESDHIMAEMLPGSYFPAYPLGDYYLWGFTYRILRNVLGMEEK